MAGFILKRNPGFHDEFDYKKPMGAIKRLFGMGSTGKNKSGDDDYEVSKGTFNQ